MMKKQRCIGGWILLKENYNECGKSSRFYDNKCDTRIFYSNDDILFWTTKMYILIDIDHTLADSFWRDKMIGVVPWDQYYEQSQHDRPFKKIVKLIRSLKQKYEIICITGRPEKWRGLTVNWLIKNDIPVADLLMRPDGDFCKNVEMKVKLITKYFGGIFEHIEFLIDDNEETILEFNKLGITTLQVRNITGG